MKSVHVVAMLVSLGITAGAASAQVFELPPTNLPPPTLQLQWTCKTGAGQVCTANQLSQPSTYRQVLVLPTGYNNDEYDKFFADAEQLRVSTSDPPGELVFTEQQRDRILYITYWIAGSDLTNLPTANFGAAVLEHPIRGYALSLAPDRVYTTVDGLRATLTWLDPNATVVLYDTDAKGAVASASEPSFTQRKYGIARIARNDVGSSYVGPHELGHAMLSYVDEYVEPGLENMNIAGFDVLTPFLLFNGSWASLQTAVGDLLGLYDLRMSEILANNGADNVSTSRYPSTVSSGLPQDVYEYEGGLLFGHGTFHDAGRNVMNNDLFNPQPDNGFAYAHSPAQQRIVSTAFGSQPGRANDRLRNAGPTNRWTPAFGSDTTVMMFDADKNHRWHPTTLYQLRVGWYERVWQTCWFGFYSYPCYTNVWRTVMKGVFPHATTVDFRVSAAYGLTSVAQDILCQIGVDTNPVPGGSIDMCSQPDPTTWSFLPTAKFYLPYETTTVPTTQWFTTYFWSFQTYNGTYWSGWTSWSPFFRSF